MQPYGHFDKRDNPLIIKNNKSNKFVGKSKSKRPQDVFSANEQANVKDKVLEIDATPEQKETVAERLGADVEAWREFLLNEVGSIELAIPSAVDEVRQIIGQTIDDESIQISDVHMRHLTSLAVNLKTAMFIQQRLQLGAEEYKILLDSLKAKP
jgi:hypothetical protein